MRYILTGAVILLASVGIGTIIGLTAAVVYRIINTHTKKRFQYTEPADQTTTRGIEDNNDIRLGGRGVRTGVDGYNALSDYRR